MQELAETEFTLAALKQRGSELMEEVSEKVEEAIKGEPNPENVVVTCMVELRTEFMRRFDCEARGGKVLVRR